MHSHFLQAHPPRIKTLNLSVKTRAAQTGSSGIFSSRDRLLSKPQRQRRRRRLQRPRLWNKENRTRNSPLVRFSGIDRRINDLLVLIVGAKTSIAIPLVPGGKTNKQLKREAKWEQRKEKREAFKKNRRLLEKQQELPVA